MHSRRHFLQRCLAAVPAVGVVSRASGESQARSVPDFNIDFSSVGLSMETREKWASTPPDPRRLHAAGRYDLITIHHTGATRNFDTIENAVSYDIDCICAGHLSRHYGDIGYHFVVDYAGRLWQGRDLRYQGAHVLGYNARNVGVVVLGNFERQNPSAKQLATLKGLVAAVRRKFTIPAQRVYGHRDLRASACPGRNLYAHLSRLRAS